MIKNSKKTTGLDALVICDNCETATIQISEANLIDYERQWLSGITFDICPECQKSQLKDVISIKMSAERKVLENYEIKRAAINNFKG